MENKIDAVILFVDMNDHNWRETYNNYVLYNDIPNKHINNDARFKDYGSLRVVLRSIEMYAPWINNIYLVVQSESQVPKWINRNEVNIVLHKEFIPKEYLPTFNCNTIETHLHLIPGLSERFIYFNDDTLLIDINYPEYYFINDKCVHYITQNNCEYLTTVQNKFYVELRYSNVKQLGTIYKTLKDYVFFNSHGPTPMLKSICDKIYNLVNVKDSISVFREQKNLTQELFTVFSLLERQLIHLINSSNINYTVQNINHQYTSENHNMCKLNLFTPGYKTFCINDVFANNEIENNEFIYTEIEELLLLRFPNKCKYEI